MDNNQIFRNWFVIIHRHLTKVSAKIIQCIIFERNELYNTINSMVIFTHQNKCCFGALKSGSVRDYTGCRVSASST